MTVHYLKCWPPYFGAVRDRSKTFEIRKDDRGFQAGDMLVLLEWNDWLGAYTGARECRIVTYVLAGGRFGLAEGHVAMGLRHPTDVEHSRLNTAEQVAHG